MKTTLYRHCIPTYNPEEFTIILGTSQLSDTISSNSTRQKLSTKQLLNPFIFSDPKPFDHDMVLLNTEETIVFTPQSQSIEIATPDDTSELKKGSLTYLSGWGIINDGGTMTNDRKEVQMSFINNDDAKKLLNDSNFPLLRPTENMLATINLKNATGCKRDRSRTLTFTNSSNEEKLIGIVSFGGCRTKDNNNYSPVIYTKVSNYLDWINSHISNTTVEKCVKELVLTKKIDSDTIYTSSNSITASNTITAANVIYSAKKNVSLPPGFKTESGAIFNETIEGYNPLQASASRNTNYITEESRLQVFIT